MLASVIGILCYMTSLRGVVSVGSEACLARLQRGVPAEAPCHSPVCGSLQADDTRTTFLGRLSPSCRRVMQSYAAEHPSQRYLRTAAETTSAAYGLRTLAADKQPRQDGDFVKCSSSGAAHYASNPVVVERPDTSNFVLCTVPKAGCSLFRSLLFALTHPPEASTSFHGSVVHKVPYPTIWHYSGISNLPDGYPSVRLSSPTYSLQLTRIDPSILDLAMFWCSRLWQSAMLRATLCMWRLDQV